MRNLLDQIEKSLQANLYYLSLFAVLSLPDICGAINSENGEASGEKYKDWFDKYVAPKYRGSMTGEDCYYFRCSLLHQGGTQHQESKYSRVLFVEPTATTNVFHNNILNDALNLDVRIFCSDIIEGVKSWLADFEDTELFKRNYDKFMRRYPDGIPPYISGVAVIS